MLVTFRSPPARTVVYIDDVAQDLLQRMGRTGNVPGALRADDVPEAIANLQRSLDANGGNEALTSRDDDPGDRVSAATRALPLLELLRKAVANDAYVTWES